MRILLLLTVLCAQAGTVRADGNSSVMEFLMSRPQEESASEANARVESWFESNKHQLSDSDVAALIESLVDIDDNDVYDRVKVAERIMRSWRGR